MKNIIREKLSESLTFDLLENILIDEDYPINFNMEDFKSLQNFDQRIEYCEQNLKRISSGSSRIVYMIDKTKVLKLAKNKKGLAQNEVEIDWGGDSYFENILAHTFDYHPDNLWVEMELARKVNRQNFIKLTGCNINFLIRYLKDFELENNGKKKIFNLTPKIIEELENNEFANSLCDYIYSTDSPTGDLGKFNTYGIVKRNGKDTVVIIDFGLNNDVYQSYYS